MIPLIPGHKSKKQCPLATSERLSDQLPVDSPNAFPSQPERPQIHSL